ncbi:MAG: tRNA-intron lyase [Candidatus Bathyarchaeia archaeon]|jgi:tRNA-intron endonuclease
MENSPVPVPQTPAQTQERPQFTPWNAVSEGRLVYLPYKSELMELRDRGFGELRKGKLLLSLYESFYLVEKQKIRVFAKKGNRELELRDLVRTFSVGRPEIWIKYLVYRDLRDRGYIVRESTKAFDFDIYGKGPLRRLISIIYEGGEASLRKLRELLQYSDKEKKELILAVVDRRTDIVYYTLNSLKV